MPSSFRMNRRRSSNSVLMPVLVRVDPASKPTHCQGVNISEDRMFIITALDLTPGMQVNAKFTLPGRNRLSRHGAKSKKAGQMTADGHTSVPQFKPGITHDIFNVRS